MPTTFSFDCYISVGQHEISDSDTSGCTFILQDCFNYLEIVFFVFYMKLNIVLLRFVKNCVGIL